MTFEFLLRRLTRIVSRPPEILYALSRRWLYVAVWLVLGTAVGWVLAFLSEPVFEGRIRVFVAPSNSPRSGRDESVSSALVPTMRDDQAKVFLATQAAIIASDTVVGELLEPLVKQGALQAAQTTNNPRRRLRDRIKRFRDDLLDALKIQQADPAGNDVALQEAITQFKSRSAVRPDPDTQSIVLLAYGTNREGLKQLLLDWTAKYQERLEFMSNESWNAQMEARTTGYTRLEEDAARELKDAMDSKDAASLESRLLELERMIARAQLQREEIWSQMHSPDSPLLATVGPGGGDQHVQTLKKKLIELRTGGAPEESQEVQRILKTLEWVREMGIGEAGGRSDSGTDKESRLEARYERITEDLQEFYVDQAKLKEKQEEIRRLKDEYRRLRDQRKSMEQLSVSESQQGIVMQISDGPVVGAVPFQYRPILNILLAAFAGLVIGAVMAVLRETLSGRVRSRHDVISDCGLPVVAVFPK